MEFPIYLPENFLKKCIVKKKKKIYAAFFSFYNIQDQEQSFHLDRQVNIIITTGSIGVRNVNGPL